jgi:hypothetical protein
MFLSENCRTYRAMIQRVRPLVGRIYLLGTDAESTVPCVTVIAQLNVDLWLRKQRIYEEM